MKRTVVGCLLDAMSIVVSLSSAPPALALVACARPDGAVTLRARCTRTETPVLPLASPGDGPSRYQCQSTPGHYTCTCQGEGSADCDKLFAACDYGGGLFSCASDYGGAGDMCGCEYY